MKQATVTTPSTTPTAEAVKQPEAKAPSTDYVVLPEEADHYHIEVEVESWNRNNKLSTPHIAKISQPSFIQYMTDHVRLGLTIHRILHDPAPDKTPERLARAEANRNKGHIAK